MIERVFRDISFLVKMSVLDTLGFRFIPDVKTYSVLGTTHTELNKIEKKLFNIPMSSEGQQTGEKRTSDRFQE